MWYWISDGPLFGAERWAFYVLWAVLACSDACTCFCPAERYWFAACTCGACVWTWQNRFGIWEMNDVVSFPAKCQDIARCSGQYQQLVTKTVSWLDTITHICKQNKNQRTWRLTKLVNEEEKSSNSVMTIDLGICASCIWPFIQATVLASTPTTNKTKHRTERRHLFTYLFIFLFLLCRS